MTDSARGDVEAIRRQGDVLRTFATAAEGLVQQAERAAADVRERISDETGHRRAALSAAEAQLGACEREEGADCSYEARAVAQAERALADAERASRMAERALREFHGPRARFRREVDTLTTGGRTLLSTMASDLDLYLQVAGGGGGGLGLGGGSSGSSTAAGSAQPAGLPGGVSMVPLASIDASDSGVTGPESFGKGYSPDDLAWAFDALHEVVLPAVGHGLGAEYFQSRDQAEGLVGTRSYSDTYSGFFGDSAIKLESRGDGTYGVANGYHRVWVAQRLGLDSVPGRVR